MAFNMAWRFAPVPVPEGRLPVPLAEVFVDFDAPVNGVGTRASPYNQPLGMSVGDVRVGPGTRVTCRGRWRSTVGNFGQFLVAGTEENPLVYVGNDPSWGQCTVDGSVQLAPSACANIGEAKGNVHWANMRKASIAGLGGNDPEDYLHCLYGGNDREIRYLSGYPQLPNDEAFYRNLFIPPNSLVDVWWYPGINPGAPNYADGTSRPRLNIANMDAWLVANNPGYVAGDLASALDADSAPILLMRVAPNVWFTARVGRCDADGTLNPAGVYLTPIDGSRLTGESGTYASADLYQFRILNLAKAVDRPGTYAMNPAGGWLVEWPYGAEPLFRAQGKSGLEFAANYVWLHGFKICGMSTSKTTVYPTGADGGNSLTLAPSGVNANTIRIQRCFFPAFGSIGGASRQQSYDEAEHAQRYFNTYRRQAIGSAINFGTGEGARVKFNNFDYIHGSNVRVIGTHTRNVVIGGNLIQNCNDIHGNGITLYTAGYGITVEYNVVKNVGRPLTTEVNNAYDPAYGPPSKIYRKNLFLASSDGTSSALRLQGGSEKGHQLYDNRLWGGPEGNTPFNASASLSIPDNGPVNGNVGVGNPISGTALTLWNAGAGNTQYTLASPEGAALVAAWQLEGVDPDYAPQGVGWTAGGWDGNA